MKHFFSSSLTTALLGGILLLGACKKDSGDSTPAPTPDPTATITGKFSPANGVAGVNVRGSLTPNLVITPAADGSFSVTNLKTGTYAVSFTPATGFNAPPAKSVSVTAGQTTDLGLINVTPNGTIGTGGTVTYKVNGSSTTTTATQVTSIYGGNTLVISAGIPATGTVALSISGITAPGSFTVGSTSAVGAFTIPPTPGGAVWSSSISGTGTIDVTTFNLATRKATGTFTFTAAPVPGTSATGTVSITTGVFTDVNF